MSNTSIHVKQSLETPSFVNRWFGSWSHWSTFEKSWLGLFALVTIAVFFLMDDTILGLIASLAGMICVVMVAKGLIGNYLFGIIQVSLYGYLSIQYGLFGEAMLNLAFYLPTQFIGLWLWSRNRRTIKDTDTDEVIAKKLTGIQIAGIAIASVILIACYAWLLKTIGGNEVSLDSATTVLSIIAQILMLLRYREQWIMWIVINVLSIIMWVFTLNAQDGTDWTLVVMWSAFLVNSIYGYWNWTRLANKDKDKDTPIDHTISVNEKEVLR